MRLKYFKPGFIILAILPIVFAAFVLINSIGATVTPKLKIIYPKNMEQVSPQDGKCYVLGQVEPANTSVSINGETVQVSEDGAFLHYGQLHIQENDTAFMGSFNFKMTLNQSVTEKSVTYTLPPPMKTSPDYILTFDNSFKHSPAEDIMSLPGEVLNVTVKGTPGCIASFKVEGINAVFPMAQTDMDNIYNSEAAFGKGFASAPEKIFGIYKGHIILPRIGLQKSKITVALSNEKLGTISRELSGSISINLNSMYEVGEIKESETLIPGRTGPGLGYKLFLSKGSKAIIDGEKGEWYRMKLADNEHIYVPKYAVNLLPMGTPPPSSNVRVIRTRAEQNFIRIELGLSENLPFEVTEDLKQSKLIIKIFGATSDIDWIWYDESRNVIDNINWKQIKDNILEISINTVKKQMWGYYTFYEGNVLVIKVKKPISASRKFLFWGNSLSERKIVIDPGHNPEPGAIGPRGTKEKDVNLALSYELKKILENRGARVFLTREQNELELTKRKAKVLSFEPDISVSIHNNAVPDGVNPLIHNGSSVYYYNSHSKLLAKYIHESLSENLSFVDFGLYWDNLYMCRIPETISVLVEPAFIIHPEQEKFLLTEEGRKKIAEAIAEGIENFFDNSRE